MEKLWKNTLENMCNKQLCIENKITHQIIVIKAYIVVKKIIDTQLHFLKQYLKNHIYCRANDTKEMKIISLGFSELSEKYGMVITQQLIQREKLACIIVIRRHLNSQQTRKGWYQLNCSEMPLCEKTVFMFYNMQKQALPMHIKHQIHAALHTIEYQIDISQ